MLAPPDTAVWRMYLKRLGGLRKATADESDDGDIDEQALLVSEILYSLYGDHALTVVQSDHATGKKRISGMWRKAWESIHHPRGKDGRFIHKGSGEAGSAAKEAVGKVLKGGHHGETPESILGHLNNLSVKQLRELHKEHGQKVPGRLRQQLVDGIKARLQASGGEKKPETKEEKPKVKPSPAKEPAKEGKPASALPEAAKKPTGKPESKLPASPSGLTEDERRRAREAFAV